MSTFAVSSDEPGLTGAPKEMVREGSRILLRERKPGDPRTESGCKEFDRSIMIGDRDPVATDAADGRRAILFQSHKSVRTNERTRISRKRLRVLLELDQSRVGGN